MPGDVNPPSRSRSLRRRWALLLCLLPAMVSAAPLDHSDWDQLLGRHVAPLRDGRATVVDYGGMRRDEEQLNRYLGAMSAVSAEQFENWPRSEQLAFLINAYNAWTVSLILSEWPRLESIKELGGWLRSPWRREFIPLLGKRRSLDDIEHGLIRDEQRYREPRIHFAVNCASVGCPALRAEAYAGARLDRQLDEQTRLFLADRRRNRLVEDALYLSSIFKWYRRDFERGWRDYGRLEEFLLDYGQALGLDARARQGLADGTLPIRFLEYDWRLNDKDS